MKMLFKVEYFSRDDVMSLCISKGWYTRGNNEQYERMLSYVEEHHKYPTIEDIYNVSKDIMEHSNDTERPIDSFMYEIYKKCVHTYFEVD